MAGLVPASTAFPSSLLGLRETRSSWATVNLSPLSSAKFSSGAFFICSNSSLEGLDLVLWWLTIVLLGLTEEMGMGQQDVLVSMGPTTGCTEVTQLRSSCTKGEEHDSPRRGLLVGDSFKLRQSGLSGWAASGVYKSL